MPIKFFPFLKEKLKKPTKLEKRRRLGSWWRVPNKVLQSRNLDPKVFLQSRNLTRAHTFNPESSPFLLLP